MHDPCRRQQHHRCGVGRPPRINRGAGRSGNIGSRRRRRPRWPRPWSGGWCARTGRTGGCTRDSRRLARWCAAFAQPQGPCERRGRSARCKNRRSWKPGGPSAF